MSRYLGPIWKKSRALGFPLLGGKEFSQGKKRMTPPGQHGNSKKKKRWVSVYKEQNQEKQKICYYYGLRKRQLRNLFIKLKKKPGDISLNLMRWLESRLDNLVFRSGLARTRKLARQLVNHGHFLVNGKKVNIPSFQLKTGMTISPHNLALKENQIIKNNLEQNIKFPDYISFDKEKLIINYLRLASEEEIAEININTHLVVEWYNKIV